MEPTFTLREVVARWGPRLPRGSGPTSGTVVVQGRIVSAYQEGPRLVFWTLHQDGVELQVLLTAKDMDGRGFAAAVDIVTGVVVVEGPLLRTRRGMLTVVARRVLRAEAP